MKILDELLSKFKLIPDPGKNKIRVAEILKRVLMVNIPEENIDIKGNKITVTLQPVLKSMLFTHKEETLKQIQAALSLNNISILFK